MKVRINELRPNNWFLNQSKVESIEKIWIAKKQQDLPPILIAKIDNEFAIIDGHTRAFVAHRFGEVTISVEVQELEQIDHHSELYKKLHTMGPSVGVNSVSDLSDRILSPQEYQMKWINFCKKLL